MRCLFLDRVISSRPFLGKTLSSQSASFHPGVKMGTGEFNAGDNPVMD